MERETEETETFEKRRRHMRRETDMRREIDGGKERGRARASLSEASPCVHGRFDGTHGSVLKAHTRTF